VSRWWHPIRRRLTILSFARRELWSERYDLALVPRWGPDRYEASTLAYLSGARVRVGYSERVSARKRRENRGFDRLFTRLVDDRTVKHEVQRNVDLLSVIGIRPVDMSLEVWLRDEDMNLAATALKSNNREPLVALGVGARTSSRRWPIDRYAEVGHRLAAQGARLVVVGGDSDEDAGRDLRHRLGGSVIDLTGRTTLRQSAAVLRSCSLYVGNDSGPMHLAAAAGVPVVEISSHPSMGDALESTSPARFGPWGVPHRVVQPDHPSEGCSTRCRAPAPHCILQVPSRSVISAVESLMGNPSDHRGSSPR